MFGSSVPQSHRNDPKLMRTEPTSSSTGPKPTPNQSQLVLAPPSPTLSWIAEGPEQFDRESVGQPEIGLEDVLDDAAEEVSGARGISFSQKLLKLFDSHSNYVHQKEQVRSVRSDGSKAVGSIPDSKHVSQGLRLMPSSAAKEALALSERTLRTANAATRLYPASVIRPYSRRGPVFRICSGGWNFRPHSCSL